MFGWAKEPIHSSMLPLSIFKSADIQNLLHCLPGNKERPLGALRSGQTPRCDTLHLAQLGFLPRRRFDATPVHLGRHLERHSPKRNTQAPDLLNPALSPSRAELNLAGIGAERQGTSQQRLQLEPKNPVV